jgi:hypothetical protein
MREVVGAWLPLSPEDEVVKRAARQLERYEDRLRKAGEWHQSSPREEADR